MSVQLQSGDPIWAFDQEEIARQVATFAKANGITGQAAWSAFVAGITTLNQAIAVCKGLLSSVKTNTP